MHRFAAGVYSVSGLNSRQWHGRVVSQLTERLAHVASAEPCESIQWIPTYRIMSPVSYRQILTSPNYTSVLISRFFFTSQTKTNVLVPWWMCCSVNTGLGRASDSPTLEITNIWLEPFWDSLEEPLQLRILYNAHLFVKHLSSCVAKGRLNCLHYLGGAERHSVHSDFGAWISHLEAAVMYIHLPGRRSQILSEQGICYGVNRWCF